MDRLEAYFIARVLLLAVFAAVLVMFIKHPEITTPCLEKNSDGTQELTGLYGNCAYLTRHCTEYSTWNLSSPL